MAKGRTKVEIQVTNEVCGLKLLVYKVDAYTAKVMVDKGNAVFVSNVSEKPKKAPSAVKKATVKKVKTEKTEE